MVFDNSARDTVDWRQLQRWHIAENRLPPATVELFRESSLWERYRYLIGAAISLCILETVLILALLFSVQRRKHAEAALRREKALAEAVIESLPGVFLLQDRAGKNVRWNTNAERVSRYPPGETSVLGNVADRHKEAAHRARDEVFESGSTQLEAELLLQGGATAPYYFTGVRVELEGVLYSRPSGLT